MNNIIIDFLESIYLLNKLPEVYKTSNSNFTQSLQYSNTSNNLPDIKDNILIIKDIPSYINLQPKDLPKNIKPLNIDYYSGYAMNFKGVDNLQSYLKSRFGNSSRYKLRRSIKKLENAFDINYKMYYGIISQKEYDFIFDEFFELLEIRSIEKGISNNRNLKKKSYYYNLVLPLILQKKASLFVIYNGKKPIDISLNFHADALVFQLIRTYDINYSKYNTGYIDLMKQIEWCLENNISMISFGYGAYYWKKRWCNYNYPYHFNIYYNKNSVKSYLKAQIQIANLKLRHKLRERGTIDKFHEIKAKINNKLTPKKELQIVVKNIDFNKKINFKEKLNLYDPKHNILIKPIYEFLFNYNDKEKDIQVFKITNKPNEYLVNGTKNKIIISIK